MRSIVIRILQFPIHPVLVSIFPIVSLLNVNAEGVHPKSALRSLVLASSLSLAIVAVNIKRSQNPHRTAVIISTSILMAFSFGHLVNVIEPLLMIGRLTSIVVFLVVLVTIALSAILSKRLHTSSITKLLNIVAGVLLFLPLFQLVRHEIAFSQIPDEFREPLKIEHGCPGSTSGTRYPDIYYILLDGYARADVLQEIYSFDNTTFLNDLTTLGFEIQKESVSNYAQTNLSLASVLNANYIQDIFPTFEKPIYKDIFINGLIQNSEIVNIFGECGYSTIAFETGYRRTELREADHYYSDFRLALNSFESFLLETSVFRLVYQIADMIRLPLPYPGYAGHRDRIEFTLQELPELNERFEQPIFVFAHFISPHPPFVFTSEGEAVDPSYPYIILDADEFPGSTSEYQKGFVAQTMFINTVIHRLVEQLLVSYDRNVIIILQSDHGPGLELVWDAPTNSSLKERMSILNAIHIPDNLEIGMLESSSQVNTFRYLMNGLFGTSLTMLKDRSFFSSWSGPTNFVEYTQTLP